MTSKIQSQPNPHRGNIHGITWIVSWGRINSFRLKCHSLICLYATYEVRVKVAGRYQYRKFCAIMKTVVVLSLIFHNSPICDDKINSHFSLLCTRRTFCHRFMASRIHIEGRDKTVHLKSSFPVRYQQKCLGVQRKETAFLTISAPKKVGENLNGKHFLR